ncbi:MAG: dipeptidyl-peptidase 3 family protein, partial [Tepidiformaceae bacterium]
MRLISLVALALLAACSAQSGDRQGAEPPTRADSLLAQYTTVRLTTDLAALTEHERRMIPLLIEAAQAMDEVFWLESSGPRGSVLMAVTDPD